ncbi:MAG: hypothetical protein H6705_16790 [Myxococcales bacterium]|nr:hypothetical protein [Myxococcales bacterium]
MKDSWLWMGVVCFVVVTFVALVEPVLLAYRALVDAQRAAVEAETRIQLREAGLAGSRLARV